MKVRGFIKAANAFTQLLFVQALIIGLTIIVSLKTFAQDECLNSKPTHHYGFCVAQKLHQIFDPNNKTTYTIEELSNGIFEKYTPPKSSHGSGVMHSEIYRIKKDDKAFLIKTIMPGSRGFKGSKNDNYFMGDVFGYLLSSELGGPEIGRIGRFKSSAGKIGYFIEMEELFAGDETSTTFKGLERIKNLIKQKLGFRILTENHLRNFAKLIVTALEHGIYLDDHDFIFSQKSDEVRWIDTTHWDILTMENFKYEDDSYIPWYFNPKIDELLNHGDLTNPLGQNAVYHVGEMFNRMKPMHRSYVKELWLYLNIEIKNSKVWNQDQQSRVINNLRWSLMRFKWFSEDPSYICEILLN